MNRYQLRHYAWMCSQTLLGVCFFVGIAINALFQF